MKKALGLISLVVFITFLICSCNAKDYVVASVNGEDILHSEIETAVNSLNDGTISYEIVLRNSINELIVVQMGSLFDVGLDEVEFEAYIENYRMEYPDFYATGAEIYGESKYIEGLYRQRVFRLVKEHVLNNIIDVPDVTEQDLSLYCQNYGIDITLLSEDEYAEVSNRALAEMKDQLFFSWMLDQWEENDIVINDPSCSRDELFMAY